jgi:hypothetical protein
MTDIYGTLKFFLQIKQFLGKIEKKINFYTNKKSGKYHRKIKNNHLSRFLGIIL